MIHRILHSRGFVSALLAMGAGVFLYYTHPFPADQIFLRVIAMRAPHAFLSFRYLYNTILFTTPFMVFSTVLSGPNRIGPTPSAPSPVSTLPHSSSRGSPTSVNMIKPTPNITLAIP